MGHGQPVEAHERMDNAVGYREQVLVQDAACSSDAPTSNDQQTLAESPADLDLCPWRQFRAQNAVDV